MAKDWDYEGLERIEGVHALPPGAEDGGAGSMSDDAAERFAAEEMLDEVADFCRSGWSFAAGTGPGYGVYKQAGRLFVMGDTLNVKFAAETSAAEIDALLDAHNLRKKRSLGFADNLMTVSRHGTGDEDPLALTRRLADDPRVEFAEPVLVERLGGRRGSADD